MFLPIFIGIYGYTLTSETKNFLQEKCPLGIILFSNNIKSKEQLLELIADIRNFNSKILIAIDYEGGSVHRFSEDIPVIASSKAMSRKIYWEKISKNIEVMAKTLAFFDIDINFSPVLDIVRQDTNKALQNRGFFPDWQLISYYNKIFYQIHSEYGVHTTTKHFAGLSHIDTDPHTNKCTFEGNLDDFELGLKCYESLCEEPLAQSVMTSHTFYSFLDEKNPLTFSSKILSKYLKEKLQFQGIVFSDCLEMKASSNFYPPEKIAAAALQSGHDILISSGQIEKRNFCEKIIKGIENYFQSYPKEKERRMEKINNWQEKILQGKKKIDTLPDYNFVVKLNKDFIERKIVSTIEKISKGHLVAMPSQLDILQKIKSSFLSWSSSQVFSDFVDLEDKVLILILDEEIKQDEKLKEFFAKLSARAKQILVIAVSFSADIPCNEQLILWGKNHLVIASLVAILKDKEK